MLQQRNSYMANRKKISELGELNSITGNDLFVVVDAGTSTGTDASSSGNTSKIRFDKIKESMFPAGAPVGEKGEPGTKGEPSVVPGTKGEPGIGTKGEKGSNGSSIVGPQGPVGSTGGAGPAGPPGPIGASITGPQGTRGYQGTRGPQGTGGPQGIRGPQGVGGPQGARGFQGSIGQAVPYPTPYTALMTPSPTSFTGGSYRWSYTRVGKMMHLNIRCDWAYNVQPLTTAIITCVMPSSFKPRKLSSSHIVECALDIDGGSSLVGSGHATIGINLAGTTVVSLNLNYHSGSATIWTLHGQLTYELD